ncbi:Bifunctional purine biosynthesis protein PurH [Rhodovulum sulfidophilum]|uniref:Bifunctional purine biosynthesis protein PurH n=1 Tax=Rhodovulum sulfidophilum TaxID=35806 RepID=A0A0D6B812_RHOSU|nr:Bifunctional purine biosynthesis protein PurH [Rhodovulum sulfidophilum]
MRASAATDILVYHLWPALNTGDGAAGCARVAGGVVAEEPCRVFRCGPWTGGKADGEAAVDREGAEDGGLLVQGK